MPSADDPSALGFEPASDEFEEIGFSRSAFARDTDAGKRIDQRHNMSPKAGMPKPEDGLTFSGIEPL